MHAFEALRSLAPLCSALALIAACQSSPPTPDPPAALAIDASALALRRGVLIADEAQRGQQSYRVTLRLNPCRCQGPPLEVQMLDGWSRAFVEAAQGQKQAAEQLDAWEQQQIRLSELRAYLLVEGKLGRDRIDETGRRWPVFVIERVIAPLPR
jgi:hypothetical protein